MSVTESKNPYPPINPDDPSTFPSTLEEHIRRAAEAYSRLPADKRPAIEEMLLKAEFENISGLKRTLRLVRGPANVAILRNKIAEANYLIDRYRAIFKHFNH